jgi:phosphate transport system permease protein
MNPSEIVPGAALVEMPQKIEPAEQAKTWKRARLAGRRRAQGAAFGLLWLAGLVTLFALAVIVIFVLARGAGQIDLAFLTTPPRGGLSGEGGMSTTIVTTLLLVVVTIVIAGPLGVGAAVYLAEYAAENRGARGVVPLLVNVARTGVETLAGVPSIIFGLFGYALFVVVMHFGFSILSGALAGACLILPVIIRTTEETLYTVPRSYREGSLALGATKWQTIWNVVLPTALPGILTGIVLSVGRIISETAVFYVTLGGSYNMPTSLLDPGRTMALHLFYLATDTNAFEKAMATGVVLIVSTVLINLIIHLISRRLTTKVRG